MERLHQMNIIPDVLPDFHPSFDMRLTAPDMNAATHRAGRWKNVEPGSFVPTISVSAFTPKSIVVFQLTHCYSRHANNLVYTPLSSIPNLSSTH